MKFLIWKRKLEAAVAELQTTKKETAMPKVLGDLHNFGMAVTYCKENPSIVVKPRTLYWESLFFGTQSPLIDIFKNTPLEKFFCIENIAFNDEIAQKIIKPDSVCKFDPSSFGYLLGYCFFFGLQDIHKDNIIKKEYGPQPIDVEVVFSNLISPSQTHLIPGPNIEYNRTPLSAYFSSLEDIGQSMVISILLGFESFFSDILFNRKKIISKLSLLQSEPIRVIFRDTKAYSNPGSIGLIPEEKVQLARGDIPYFFKFLNSDELYFYSSRNKQKTRVVQPDSLYKISSRIGIKPANLLNDKSLKNQYAKALISSVMSFRDVFDSNQEINLNLSIIKLSEKSITLNSSDSNIVLKF